MLRENHNNKKNQCVSTTQQTENGGSRFVLNFEAHIPNHTVSHRTAYQNSSVDNQNDKFALDCKGKKMGDIPLTGEG